MPVITANGLDCHYTFEGPATAPVIMFVHALGLDRRMWDAQATRLSGRARVLRYDLRGHGGSSVPAGDYTIADLGHDALALAGALQVQRFAVCGQSLGGMIAIWLAAHAPDRLTHAVLANTSAKADGAAMEARRRAVLEQGISAMADAAVARFFSPAFIERHDPVIASTRETLLASSPDGYAACCAAIRDMDQTGSLAGIRVPALVIGSDRDVSMPWPAHGAVLASLIPGAQAVQLAGAHLSCLESPDEYTAALSGFVLE